MIILYISNYCLGVNSYDFDHSIMINHDSQIRKLVTMMKSIHHYNDFLIKSLPGGRPRPFFATGLPSSSNAGSALKKTKLKYQNEARKI